MPKIDSMIRFGGWGLLLSITQSAVAGTCTSGIAKREEAPSCAWGSRCGRK